MCICRSRRQNTGWPNNDANTNTDTETKPKLELCAFALKGEHNVYSLVPNIPVCIYIDQKLIYMKLYSASKWPPVAILDIQKSLLTISDQYHNL